MEKMSSTPAAVAAAMRKEARRNTGKEPTFRIFNGWKFGLSYGPVPLPAREEVERFKGPIAERTGSPALGKASYEQIATTVALADVTHAKDNQWIFSASLHPRGRGSVEADWRFLGVMVAGIGAPPGSLLTPLETTNPNDVFYWVWDEKPGN